MTCLRINLKTIVNFSPVVLRHLNGDRKILSIKIGLKIVVNVL